MKNHRQLLIAASLLSSLSLGRAQFFTAGNLVVLQDGNGSGTLTSAGASIFLDQYSTTGTLVNDVAITSSGTGELVDSGTASSEGQLSLSANGQSLVFAGYNVAAGTTGISGAASTAAPRGLGTVGANGTYSLATTSTSAYSGNNIRGGTSDGNGNYWGAGAANSGGTYYFGTGTPAQVSAVNSLAVKDLGGNLFYSTAKGTTGIYEIAGTPTAGPTTPTLLIASAAPSGFSFNTSMTLAYVADTAGGIQRYDFNGTAWTLTYTLDGTTAMDAVAVDYANDKIYFTTADGKTLGEITDTGAASTASTLATVDGTTEVFRGIDFAPTVPEPTTLALVALGTLALLPLRRRRA